MKKEKLELDIDLADTPLGESFAEVARFVADAVLDLNFAERPSIVTSYDGHKLTVEISGT